MKVIENKILPLGGYKALCLLNCIFIHKGTQLTASDIQHEAIHWEQWKELLILGFLPVYCAQFVWEYIRCLFDGDRGKVGKSWKNGTWRRAYRSVALEKEAYDNENVEGYLDTRKHFAWARKKIK